MSERISELFMAVALWAGEQGAKDITLLPGCWHGEHKHDGDRITVDFNGHRHECDGIPPISVRLASSKYLGFAVVGPSGGAWGGLPEDYWIEAFKSVRREA